MKSIVTMTVREFKAYFLTPIAYVYLTAFLVIANLVFFRGFFLIGQADLRPLFGMMPWIFLFLAPAVAMGSWAGERKTGTIEFMLTLPVKPAHVVMAKFLGGLALVATAVVLTFPAPLTVAFVGDLDWGPVVGGYVGMILLGGAYLAIGMFFSALTENQIVAFVLGLIGCFTLFIVGEPLMIGAAGGVFAATMRYLALGTHFASIARGVIDSRDVIYYLSVMGFFLYLNLLAVNLKARK